MPSGIQEGRHFLRFNSTDHLVDLLHQLELILSPFELLVLLWLLKFLIIIRMTISFNFIESLKYSIHRHAVVQQSLPRRRALFISHEQTKPGFQHGK